jgi:hypothetical protein
MKSLAFALVLMIHTAAGDAWAQSALSIQGFGYPAGGLSTRSLTVGGGVGDVDPVSTLNPAALSRWGAAGLSAHFAPEIRNVRSSAEEASTTTIRFPVYAAGIRLAERLTAGVSSSTLLDQSWSTRSELTQVVNGQLIESTSTKTSLGAINDLRFAAAYAITPSLSAGLGVHLIAGSNVVSIATDYSATDISDISLKTELGYSGSAVSGGLYWEPSSVLAFGISTRIGGGMHVERGDDEIGSASVPGRVGASLMYSGLGGVLLAARYDRVSYSDMNGLGSESARAHDTEDYGIGAELAGPRILSNPSLLRFGARSRGLPFQAIGANVMENSYSAGLGVSVAGGRAMFDLGAIRVVRDNNSDYRETAWVFASGILIRP